MLVFAYKCSHKSLQTSQDKPGPLACPDPARRWGGCRRGGRLPAAPGGGQGDRGLISANTPTTSSTTSRGDKVSSHMKQRSGINPSVPLKSRRAGEQARSGDPPARQPRSSSPGTRQNGRRGRGARASQHDSDAPSSTRGSQPRPAPPGSPLPLRWPPQVPGHPRTRHG